MIIYKITNKINGMVYIGQTKQTLKNRWSEHVSQVNWRWGCGKLRKAIMEFGRDAFTMEQIDTAETKEEANAKEMYWIAFYNSVENGYNTSKGGKDNGRSQKIMAVEDGLIFENTIKASEHYKVNHRAISQALKNPTWKSAGQHWVKL